MRTVGIVFWLSAVYCSSCSLSVLSKPSVLRYLRSPDNLDHMSLVSWSSNNHFSLHAGRDHFSRHCFSRHCALWLTLPWWAPGFFPCDHASHIRLRVKTLLQKKTIQMLSRFLKKEKKKKKKESTMSSLLKFLNIAVFLDAINVVSVTDHLFSATFTPHQNPCPQPPLITLCAMNVKHFMMVHTCSTFFFNLTHSYHFHWCRLCFSGEGFLRWFFFLMCCLTCALIIQSNHQPFCLRAKQTFLWMVSFALAAVFVQLKGITHNLCLLAVLPALWVVHGCVIYVEHHEHSIRKRQSVERRDHLK